MHDPTKLIDDRRSVRRGARCRVRSGACVWIALAASSLARGDDFIRGDVNGDGRIDLADLTAFTEAVRTGGQSVRCFDALDADDDGSITFLPSGQQNRSDFTFLRAWLLAESPVPRSPQQQALLPAPFPLAGPDPTTNDNYACVDGFIAPPPPRDPRYSMRWEAPAVLVRGETYDFYLRATTAAPIEAFSLAYELDVASLELDAADFAGTVVPEPLFLAGFTLGNFTAATDPDYLLLLFTTLFVDAQAQRVPFAATQRALADERVLHLVVRVKDDAPLGDRELLRPFLASYAPPATLLGGLRNGFANGALNATIPDFGQGFVCGVVTDPGKLLFVRGDANIDGRVDVSDSVFTLDFLFLGGLPPSSRDAADSDDNGVHEITDAVYTLNFLFAGGLPPPAPYPRCGPDATADALHGIFYPACLFDE